MENLYSTCEFNMKEEGEIPGAKRGGVAIVEGTTATKRTGRHENLIRRVMNGVGTRRIGTTKFRILGSNKKVRDRSKLGIFRSKPRWRGV